VLWSRRVALSGIFGLVTRVVIPLLLVGGPHSCNVLRVAVGFLVIFQTAFLFILVVHKTPRLICSPANAVTVYAICPRFGGMDT
jgi:hypothetical protein